MAVDFATFSQIVEHVTAVRKPVLLRGRHGIGKSTVVYQYAAQQNSWYSPDSFPVPYRYWLSAE